MAAAGVIAAATVSATASSLCRGVGGEKIHGSGGQLGVALNLMLVVNVTLAKLVLSWANLETSLGAIARLKALEETTPSEIDIEAIFEPRGTWPLEGRIELRGVEARYQ